MKVHQHREGLGCGLVANNTLQWPTQGDPTLTLTLTLTLAWMRMVVCCRRYIGCAAYGGTWQNGYTGGDNSPQNTVLGCGAPRLLSIDRSALASPSCAC